MQVGTSSPKAGDPREPAGPFSSLQGFSGRGKGHRQGRTPEARPHCAPQIVGSDLPGKTLSHVRRAFKAITKRAGLGENWTPRELRHSFVSIMSDNGVPIETIADLVPGRGGRI
jgi:integrase